MLTLRTLLALTLAAAPALAADYKPFTLPWGDAPGQVVADGASDPAREFGGPASVRLAANGDVLVVDTRGHRVQRFAPDGKLVSTATVAASTEHDAERALVDVAEGPSGDLYMLDLAERSLIRAGRDGVTKGTIKVPAGEGAILTAIGTDDKHLIAFDGAENAIVRFDAAGRAVDTLSHDLVQGLTRDAAGKWLGLELASPESCRGFKVWRVDLPAGAKQVIADFALPQPAVEVHLLGADKAGRTYVEVAYGAVENPADRQALVLSPAGQLVDRIALPPRPTQWRMLNARVVLPDGGLLTAGHGKDGLELRPHRLKE